MGLGEKVDKRDTKENVTYIFYVCLYRVIALSRGNKRERNSKKMYYTKSSWPGRAKRKKDKRDNFLKTAESLKLKKQNNNTYLQLLSFLDRFLKNTCNVIEFLIDHMLKALQEHDFIKCLSIIFESIKQDKSYCISDCFSENTRTQKSPFLCGSNVEGTMRYSPGGSLKRVLTSLRLIKVSDRAFWAWLRK